MAFTVFDSVYKQTVLSEDKDIVDKAYDFYYQFFEFMSKKATEQHFKEVISLCGSSVQSLDLFHQQHNLTNRREVPIIPLSIFLLFRTSSEIRMPILQFFLKVVESGCENIKAVLLEKLNSMHIVVLKSFADFTFKEVDELFLLMNTIREMNYPVDDTCFESFFILVFHRNKTIHLRVLEQYVKYLRLKECIDGDFDKDTFKQALMKMSKLVGYRKMKENEYEFYDFAVDFADKYKMTAHFAPMFALLTEILENDSDLSEGATISPLL